MIFSIRHAAAALALLVLATGGAHAAGAPFMATTGYTNPPVGHYDFCKRRPAECSQKSDTDTPLTLTPERWDTMLRVNYSANTRIRPETDQDIYGVQEYWTYPTTTGDCEDYVLLKRRDLIDQGFPASDLLITVVLQPNGDGHAVLTVRTDRGDFVLDNMRTRVLLWSNTEYTFLKRQSALDDSKWEKIRDGRSALVGSVR